MLNLLKLPSLLKYLNPLRYKDKKLYGLVVLAILCLLLWRKNQSLKQEVVYLKALPPQVEYRIQRQEVKGPVVYKEKIVRIPGGKEVIYKDRWESGSDAWEGYDYHSRPGSNARFRSPWLFGFGMGTRGESFLPISYDAGILVFSAAPSWKANQWGGLASVSLRF